MFAPPARRSKDRSVSAGKVPPTRPSKPLTPVSLQNPLEPALKRSSSAKENPRSASRVPAAAHKPAIARVDKGSAAAAIRNDGVRQSLPRGRSSSPSECIRVFNDRGSRVSGDKGSVGKSVSGLRGARSGSVKRNGLRDLNVENPIRVARDGKENGKVQKGILMKKMDLGEKKVSGSRVFRSAIKGGEANLSSGLLESSGLNAGSGIRNDGCRPEMNGLSQCSARVVSKFVDVVAKTESGLHLGMGLSEKKFSGSRVFRSANKGGEANLSSRLLESSGLNANAGLGIRKDECRPGMNGVAQCSARVVPKLVDVVAKTEGGLDSGLKEPFNNSLITSNVSEGLDGEGANESSVGIHAGKYPSRLHEKLAFLEGKVKRIASDIKRTKEMLDLSNPDSSKMILSDIQEKISGIEKVVGNDNCGSDGNASSLKGTVNPLKQPEALANSVNGLSGEELEARFFPHHKLLRGRTSVNVSSGISQIHEPHVAGSSCEPKVSLDPVDDDPTALEFLASLDKEQSEAMMKNGHADLVFSDVQEVDSVAATSSTVQDCSNVVSGRDATELFLTADETLGEFDDQENKPAMIMSEEIEYASVYQLNDIGCKTSTGGWFVSEGEAVLLAHDDNSCSFYDIANCEVKTEYKPPSGLSSNLWRDCWIIRAPSSDGCSGRYVVAASAGNTMDSGFCSWDFYNKDVQAFHIEDGSEPMDSRTILGPLPNNARCGRNALSNILVPETQQWWYKPSGPLIISTASGQRNVRVFDIRDGEHIMKWDLQKPVSSMDYSSPLQWRNRGKAVIAETETISIWDVNSLTPEPLLSIPLAGQKISALHVINTDAELGGGVRQRVSSSEAEGHDGVFCTHDSINILDFRHPTGVGLKIPKLNVNVQSVFSRGDSVLLGCSILKLAGKKKSCSQSQVLQFSVRKQMLFSTYDLPESNAHPSYTDITQVWGNSNHVMGVCGLGLFAFDALKDDALQSLITNSGSSQAVREVIGPDDLYSPSFDYLGSRALLISGDRPAMWKYLS